VLRQSDVIPSSVLTQHIFGSQPVEAAELVVAVEDGSAADDGHQDDVGGIVLGLQAIAGLAPSMTGPVPAGGGRSSTHRGLWHR